MNAMERWLLVIIFFIFFSACIETDIYLPAFPDMMDFFDTSEEVIQSLLTWNFLGLCISGPFYGPISDSFGRKKPLVVALSIFLLGSIMTLFAQTFDWMLWGRILQGLGSGGCFTIGTAIIFDAFQEKKAIDALAKLNSVVPFVLAAAPVAGGALNHFYGFRSNFLAIAISVSFCLLLITFGYKETLPKVERKAFDLRSIFKDFYRVLTYVPFWQLTVIISLLFAGYISFVSITAVLYVLEFGVSKGAYPIYQASLMIAYIAASFSCSKAVDRWGVEGIKKVGLYSILFGALSLVIGAFFFPTNPLLLTAATLSYVFGCVWAQTPYVTEIMDLMPEIKGSVASLFTSARLLLTAGVVLLASKYYNGTVYPLVAIIAINVLIVWLFITLYEEKMKKA